MAIAQKLDWHGLMYCRGDRINLGAVARDRVEQQWTAFTFDKDGKHVPLGNTYQTVEEAKEAVEKACRTSA